jgi:hypothetical protein
MISSRILALAIAVGSSVVLAFAACDGNNTPAIGGPAGTDAAGEPSDADDDAHELDAAGEDAALVAYIDEDKLGPPCGEPDGYDCPEEMSCARFNAVNAPSKYTCVRGPYCEALVCPPGFVCTGYDTDPPQYFCY